MREVEAIVTVVVRRRVTAVLDEHDHIVEITDELEDIEEMDLELDEIVEVFEQDEPIPDPREVE